MRLAPLALAALVLALAACTGGEPPPAPASTPAPTAVATPEASPTPEATATATPTPRRGLEWIEPAPGAFEHRTFGDGEAIDWTHAIFVLDVETGLTEGYAVAGLESYEHGYYGYSEYRGVWIETSDVEGTWRLLLDRETSQSWRWPPSALSLRAASDEHLLFEELDDGESTGSFVLADRALEETARFSVDGSVADRYFIGSNSSPFLVDKWSGTIDGPPVTFSPDGSSIVIETTTNQLYFVPVESARPSLLFELPPPPPQDGGEEEIRLGSFRFQFGQQANVGPRITATYGYTERNKEGDIWITRHTEKAYFSWDGEALPAPCPGKLSPDGRYSAVLEGSPYWILHLGNVPVEHPWPSVVITDAETCAPIFRVRSAYAYGWAWRAGWLPTSDGFVVGVREGYAIVHVGPEPALTPLPAGWPGPEAAPTEGGRYFGYAHRVYDLVRDRWHDPTGGEAWHVDWRWGDSHRERWFHPLYPEGGGIYRWLLLPPRIEFPPPSDGIAFRVAGTGSCLRLREEPDADGRVLDCLPDGERLLFADSGVEVEQNWSGGPASPHSSIALERLKHYELRVWVYVRTEDGAEGWVSHGYLAHD